MMNETIKCTILRTKNHVEYLSMLTFLSKCIRDELHIPIPGCKDFVLVTDTRVSINESLEFEITILGKVDKK